MAEQNPCNVLSLADRMALLSLYFKQGLLPPPGVQQPETPQVPVGLYDKATTEGQLLEQDDFFRFRAFSTAENVAVSFYGRILRKDGSVTPFSHVLNTATAATVFSVTPQAGEGILLGAAASVPIDSIAQGAVSAVGEIGRRISGAFVPHTLLFSGQLDDFTPLSSQITPPTPTLQRATYQFANDLTVRAIPWIYTVTPNPGRRFRFTRIQAAYAMSAVAGTRIPLIYFRNNGNSFITLFTPLSRTAGQVGAIEGSLSGGGGIVSNVGFAPLPQDVYFYDPIDVTFDADNRQAGDNITTSFIRWEES